MRLSFLALFALLSAPAAHAREYTIVIHEPPGEVALRSDRGAEGAAYWSGFAAYGKALGDAGVLRGGAALAIAPTASATEPSGYFIIDVASDDIARTWAARAPSVARGGGAVAYAHIPMAR